MMLAAAKRVGMSSRTTLSPGVGASISLRQWKQKIGSTDKVEDSRYRGRYRDRDHDRSYCYLPWLRHSALTNSLSVLSLPIQSHIHNHEGVFTISFPVAVPISAPATKHRDVHWQGHMQMCALKFSTSTTQSHTSQTQTQTQAQSAQTATTIRSSQTSTADSPRSASSMEPATASPTTTGSAKLPSSTTSPVKSPTSPTPPISSSSTTTTTTTTTRRPHIRVQVPTPAAALPEEAKPQSVLRHLKPSKLAGQTMRFLVSALTTLATWAYKTPYWTWYYATHATERAEKWAALKAAARHELHHYWNGTKLLVADIRTARTLLGKTLDGSALTRRERKQLLRTVSDLFRLVPFSMFILIPFMEFALPLALRLFPNLLPSTFQDSLKAEENMKRELQSRIAMAQFFQETLETLAKEQKKKAVRRRQELEQQQQQPQPQPDEGKEDPVNTTTDTNTADRNDTIEEKQYEESAASMLEFLAKARSGEMIPPEIIIRYANYFHDDLTLDNMPRMQLINLCRYMSIPPYGADSFLRFQLRHRIRSLKEDDQRILWEGIDSLTKMELREAVQERGMRSTGLSKDAYKRALQQWLDLSVNKNVPIALLIMSRTFFLQEEAVPPPEPVDKTKKTSATTTGPATAASTAATESFAATRLADKAVPDAAKTVGSTPSSASQETTAELTGLADAISGLDQEVLNEVILEVATSEEKLTDPEIRKLKLAVIQKQNELIRKEQEDREEAKRQQETADAAAAELDPLVETERAEKAASRGTSGSHTATTEEKIEAESFSDGMLTTEEMDALRAILSDDPVSSEREALERIKAAMKKDVAPAALDELQRLRDSIEGLSSDGIHPTNDLSEEKPGATTGQSIATRSNPMSADEADAYVADQIEKQDNAVASMNTAINSTVEEERASPVDRETQEDLEEEEDPIVARLKKRIKSMVDKIELQLSETHLKIGDKMHLLDKDRDGILSVEEVADVLQQVLKKKISQDQAMEICDAMDENHDGILSVEDLLRWIDEHSLIKLVEEGRDVDLDKLLGTHSLETANKDSSETPPGSK